MTKQNDTTPDWWPAACDEINKELDDFENKIKRKLVEFAKHPLRYLAKKNLFLYRTRGANSPQKLAEMVVQAFSSSSEETIFGKLLEACAIIVCKHAKQGRKSMAKGMDMEYDEGNTRTIMQIKSGKNWGNESQRTQITQNFMTATKIYKQGNPGGQVRCIEGIAYGERKVGFKDNHEQYVGPAFWEEISGGWSTFSEEFICLLGARSQVRFNNIQQHIRHAQMETVRVLEEKQLVQNGDIVWDKLYNFAANGDWKKNRRSNPAKK